MLSPSRSSSPLFIVALLTSFLSSDVLIASVGPSGAGSAVSDYKALYRSGSSKAVKSAEASSLSLMAEEINGSCLLTRSSLSKNSALG